jgi:hypothetical protein
MVRLFYFKGGKKCIGRITSFTFPFFLAHPASGVNLRGRSRDGTGLLLLEEGGKTNHLYQKLLTNWLNHYKIITRSVPENKKATHLFGKWLQKKKL